MTEILQKEHPVLRGKAEEVSATDILSTKTKKILREMRTALDAREDGIAIAAPQIGVPLRIFIISPRAFEIDELENDTTHLKEANESKHRIFFNPQIIKASKTKLWLEEGCLSVNLVYGRTHRSKKVSIRAKDEQGKTFTMTGNTLLSQIFQHEVDHLNGILFSDHAKGLHTIDEPHAEKRSVKRNAK